MIKDIIKYIYTRIKYARKAKIRFMASTFGNTHFEGMNQLHPYVKYSGNMGFGSYIAKGSFVNADIGRFCSIGPDVCTESGRHPYTYPYVSTSPCFFAKSTCRFQNGSSFASHDIPFEQECYYDKERKISVKIGNDVWIGRGALLLGGVHIGDGAIVLANAVVTKDVLPYSIVGGLPAKIVHYRYDKETIEWLLKIRWWENSYDWFKIHWNDLNSIDRLKKIYKE